MKSGKQGNTVASSKKRPLIIKAITLTTLVIALLMVCCGVIWNNKFNNAPKIKDYPDTTQILVNTQKLVEYTRSDGQKINILVDFQQTAGDWKIAGMKLVQ